MEQLSRLACWLWRTHWWSLLPRFLLRKASSLYFPRFYFTQRADVPGEAGCKARGRGYTYAPSFIPRETLEFLNLRYASRLICERMVAVGNIHLRLKTKVSIAGSV